MTDNQRTKNIVPAIAEMAAGIALAGFFLYITIDVRVHHEDGNLLVRSLTLACLILGIWLVYNGTKRVLNCKNKNISH